MQQDNWAVILLLYCNVIAITANLAWGCCDPKIEQTYQFLKNGNKLRDKEETLEQSEHSE